MKQEDLAAFRSAILDLLKSEPESTREQSFARREALENFVDSIADSAVKEALLVNDREHMRELADANKLAEDRLAHANALQADIEADQAGRMAFRQKHGAREDETFIEFLERLLAERADSAVKAERERRVSCPNCSAIFKAGDCYEGSAAQPEAREPDSIAELDRRVGELERKVQQLIDPCARAPEPAQQEEPPK